VDCDIYPKHQEALVSHRNAPSTETGRLRLARCVVEDGWPLRRAAERFQVSVTTAARWVARCRHEGEAGMADRSSRPHRCPRQTPTRTERRIARHISRPDRCRPVTKQTNCGQGADNMRH
jgi:leucine-zipper of insertion element IS481